MPKLFWAEAIATATYLHNRLPSEVIDNDIPFERWFQKPLNIKELKLLKLFGCIVWDYVPEKRRKRKPRSKLEDRGTRGCFVGYISSIIYKYWNFERKCFLEFYDLIFWETEFPQPIDFEQPPATVATTSPLFNSSYGYQHRQNQSTRVSFKIKSWFSHHLSAILIQYIDHSQKQNQHLYLTLCPVLIIHSSGRLPTIKFKQLSTTKHSI